MDRDATAMMGALARSLAAATADPPAYFSQLTTCMRGPCQQEVSKCRQGRQAPCLPATAKKGARAACEELRVRVLLRETARCNTNQKIAVGVKREIAKRAEAQGLGDNETVLTPHARRPLLLAQTSQTVPRCRPGQRSATRS